MSKITFQVLGIEAYDVDFQITVKSGSTLVSSDYYGQIGEFDDFAERLLHFPKNIDDIVEYQVGSPDKDSYCPYLLLSAYCYRKNGDSVIHVIYDNHENVPKSLKSEFYIETEPAILNRFGKALKEWDMRLEDEFVWEF